MPDQILVFRHGRDPVGIDLGSLREVMRMVLPSALPGAPAGVLGVVNLRGETVPVVDLEARLPAGGGRPGLDHHLLVSSVRGVLLAIAVSRVEEIAFVPPERYRPAQDALPEGVPVLGVARLDDRLIPILDPSALLTPGEVMTLQDALKRLEGVAW